MLGFGEAKGLLRDASLGCGGVADCQGSPHTLLQRDLPQLGYLPPAHTHICNSSPSPHPFPPHLEDFCPHSSAGVGGRRGGFGAGGE